MPAEATQEKGRRGVALYKRWLEATTFLELPWNVYQHPGMCEIELANGNVKRFDLAGHFILEQQQPVAVECKDYTAVGNQAGEYREFLANAYSATARIASSRTDPAREFIWVTSHPFAVSKWTKLETAEEMRSALTEHSEVLGGLAVDDELVRRVADRTWVLVMNSKQSRLTMETNEVGQVLVALKRKEGTL